MRLGTRWRAGEPPHSSVPESLHTAIAAEEAAHPHPEAWTLTWLEGRPRCELDGGPGRGGALVEISADGEVTVTRAPSDQSAFDPDVDEADIEDTEVDDADDDDDWLAP